MKRNGEKLMNTIAPVKYYYFVWGILLVSVALYFSVFTAFNVRIDETYVFGIYFCLTFTLIAVMKGLSYNVLAEYLKTYYPDEWVDIQKNPFTNTGGVNTFGFFDVMMRDSLKDDENIILCKKYFRSIIKLGLLIFLSYIILIYLLYAIS